MKCLIKGYFELIKSDDFSQLLKKCGRQYELADMM